MSIFTAECIAINDAIDLALKYPAQNYIIFTDSLSALASLKHFNFNMKTNPYILNIKNKLNDSTHDRAQIKLYWIPAHSGQ